MGNWGKEDGPKWGDKEDNATLGELVEGINERMTYHLEAMTILSLQKMYLLGVNTMEMVGQAKESPDDFPKDYSLQIFCESVQEKLMLKINCKASIIDHANPPEDWNTSQGPVETK